jgi:hypothetical protein
MRDFANSRMENGLVRLIGHAGLTMLFVALLSFLSPFGTYRFEPIERIGYWTVQMTAWVLFSLATIATVERLPRLRDASPTMRKIAATVMAALPQLGVTGTSNHVLHGWQPLPVEVIELFFSISLIGGAYVFLAERVLAALRLAPERPSQGAVPGPYNDNGPAMPLAVPSDPALLDRLPAHLRSDILCLQVEDHYVRVHGAQGSAMVLIRFSDAMRGLDHVAGSQVHRSWWVADEAVRALRRSGRTAQLILSNDMTVPVSQPYVADALARWGALETAA